MGFCDELLTEIRRTVGAFFHYLQCRETTPSGASRQLPLPGGAFIHHSLYRVVLIDEFDGVHVGEGRGVFQLAVVASEQNNLSILAELA